MAKKRKCGLGGLGSLMGQLQDAKVIVVDADADVVYAWHGGHGIHIYDESGNEVGYFMTGGHKTNATPAEVRRAIAMRQKYERD